MILAISFALTFLFSSTICQECKSDREEYRDCGSACPLTCDNYDNYAAISCIALCVKGCFCKEPYMRNAEGECVTRDECPQQLCTEPNEEYKECGSMCPTTCASLTSNHTIMCPAICKSGCFCKSPYVRNDQGQCVLKEDCDQQPTTQCTNANEEYQECGTMCPVTCSNYNSPDSFKCPMMCKAGCFCKAGYVRDEQTSGCVMTEECTVKPTCADTNETFDNCGTYCPKTCNNYRTIDQMPCPEVCKMGCFCNAPYVRDESSGKCVLTDNCPKII